MNGEVQSFLERCVNQYPMRGAVLEIGSKDICGSARRWFTKDGQQQEPTERFPLYVGIDRVEGNLVDVVMDAHKLVDKFGRECFDVVISTSQLEHDDDPWCTMYAAWMVMRPGGWLLLTVPSWRGEGPHDLVDYWRFMIEGVKVLVERVGFEVVELLDWQFSNDVMCVARKVK